MMTRKELLSNQALLKDKVRGAISGIAIGDSFGDASRKPDNQLAYGMTTDFGKSASWSTDDTEFALLTANTLLACEGKLNDDAIVAAWLEHVATQDELKRGGASEYEASRNLRKGLRPPLSGRYNSYAHSDGAAMRIAPIGVYCAGDIDAAIRMAEVDARVSHDRDGIWGAQAVAAAVAAAMADADIGGIMEAAFRPIPKDSWLYHAMNTAMDIVDQARGDLFEAWMPLHDQLWCSYKAAVPEAVAEAFGVLKLCHADFRTGVTWAGNFGRDADTIGAIVGAILGAKYGASRMPQAWIEKTRFPTGTCLPFAGRLDMLDVADRISALMLAQGS